MIPGAIDCDVHPALPGLKALFPYLPDHWRDRFDDQAMHELVSNSYPPGAPLTARPEAQATDNSAAAQLELLRSRALAPWGSSIAICNCLYGVQLLFNEDLAAAIACAMNEWIARELLDREPRLRASIIVAPQNPDLAAEEIERCTTDRRFVQVLLLVMGDMPLGRRFYWPIYAAAARHGLPIGVHAGSSYHNPTSPTGWPSYHSEEYVNQAQAFQTGLASLISEGVFEKFPNLRVVLIESGVSWLPASLWRLTKFWRGLRREVPWVDRPPAELVREHVRLTLQPFDGPPRPEQFERLWNHLGSDELLLFSTDYPHWQFDDDSPLPAGLPPAAMRKVLIDNARATYPRLMEATS